MLCTITVAARRFVHMPPPPPSDHAAFHLHLLKNPFFVKQLGEGGHIPAEYLERLIDTASKKFFSITRTDEEVSIVGEADPDDASATWRCIRIAGPMDFGVTGVMCNFTTPLKAAGVPVFAVSTWNTDFILVPNGKVNEAAEALTTDHWIFVDTSH